MASTTQTTPRKNCVDYGVKMCNCAWSAVLKKTTTFFAKDSS